MFFLVMCRIKVVLSGVMFFLVVVCRIKGSFEWGYVLSSCCV